MRPPAILLATKSDQTFDPIRHPWADSGRSFEGSVLPIFGGKWSAWGVQWPTRKQLVELVEPWEAGTLQMHAVGLADEGSYVILTADLESSPGDGTLSRDPENLAPGGPLPEKHAALPREVALDPPILLVGAMEAAFDPNTPPWHSRIRPTPGRAMVLQGHHVWGYELTTTSSGAELVGRDCAVHIGVVSVGDVQYVALGADLKTAFQGRRSYPASPGLDPSWFASRQA